MKCGLCLVVKIENDTCSDSVCLLKWVQIIFNQLNIDCNESLKICPDCSKRLKEIHNFCAFVEQNHDEALKLKTEASMTESDKFEITEIKLEYFSENEETIIEQLQGDGEQVKNEIIEEEEKTQLTTAKNSRFLDSSDVRTFIGKNAEGTTKCVYCNKTCKSVHALTCHIALMHYDRKNICQICSKEFPYKRELYRHIVEKHKKTSPTTQTKNESCKICHETFENKNALRLHLVHVHNEGHSCDTCGTSFSNKSDLDFHLKNAHSGSTDEAIENDINDRTCTICDILFNSFSNLRYHVYQEHRHETPYPCKACNLKFRYNYLLRKHFTEVHSQPDPNGCSLEDRHCVICNISFKKHKSLKNHMEIFHKGKRPFACGKCAMKFSLRMSLRRHISKVCMHRGKAANKKSRRQKSYQRGTLSSNTDSASSKNNAEIILTESTDKVIIGDDIKEDTSRELDKNECRKRNVDSKDRNETETIQEGSSNDGQAKKKYKREIVDKDDLFCCICERRYESLSGLQGHMYTKHKDEQPFACGKCGRTFRFQHKLRKHKCVAFSDDNLMNEDRFDRTCIICLKYFGTIGSLREHMYGRHRNVKPHACGSCGLTFRFHDKLRKHLNEVHPKLAAEDPDDRTCIICNISYKSIDILRQHMHVRHKSVKPFDCSSCGKSFNMNISLKRHMQKCLPIKMESSSHNIDDDAKSRTCSTCNTIFKCGKTLGLHIYQCHYEEAFLGDSNEN